MWAPLSVDELLRFVYEGTRPPRGTGIGGGDSPPPVIVRTSYGRGCAVGLCWPLGPDLSTRRYRTTVIQCSPVCFGRSGAVFTDTFIICF
ncbi:hypothetical protein AVEN_213243-1 [Araneus ventricosus]|uniref:Uncharacterized protein n=1 Tax=Araneus ventricosus TaxID=182803 RepID=A0A4Y2B5T0_ARAVE|nr:hypothetical protein AVEN_213243-1 [Araneus ventricosus]